MDAFESLIDPASMATIRKAIGDGLKTAEELYQQQIQLRRRSTTTGRYADHGDPFPVITIGFGLREIRESTGTPLRHRDSDGDMRLWEDPDRDMIVGDRFDYKGVSVEVTAIYPPEFGFQVCEIKLAQG